MLAGRGTLRPLATGIVRPWDTRAGQLTPRYTTNAGAGAVGVTATAYPCVLLSAHSTNGQDRMEVVLRRLAVRGAICQIGIMMIGRLLTLGLALLAGPGIAFAQVPTCPQLFAGGQPPALLNSKLEQRTTLLCNDAYAVLASGVTRGALWSAEHPTATSLDAARDTPREGQFRVEDRLPRGDQAQLEDYRRSGFDWGHMAPSGDMPDAQSQQQTFSLANMVPQTPELNHGVWAGIEMAVRHLAQRRGELFVVTGPAFQG